MAIEVEGLAKPSSSGALLATLIAATALAPFALQIFLPALPMIQAGFQASAAQAQLTFSLSTLTVAFTSLIYGPVSDRVGRRPTVLFGVALFIVGSVLCAIAPSIEVLILARVVQATGGGVGLVLSRTILRDLYPPERAAAMIAYVTMAMVLAPTLAPTVGGFLVDAFEWHVVFWLSAAIGAAVLVAALLALRETAHVAAHRAAGPLAMLNDFKTIVRSKRFLGYALVVACSFSTYFAFLSSAPYVVIKLMGQETSTYGVLFIAVSGGYVLGNFASTRITAKVGLDRVIKLGVIGVLLGCLVLLADTLLLGATLAGIFVPMGFSAFCQGLVMPNAQARLVGCFPNMAGSASGLGMCLQMGMASLAVQVIGSIQIGSALPMALGMTLFALGSFVALRLTRGGAAA